MSRSVLLAACCLAAANAAADETYHATKLDPSLEVPPSTNISEGVWRATPEYGAVRYTRGARPSILIEAALAGAGSKKAPPPSRKPEEPPPPAADADHVPQIELSPLLEPSQPASGREETLPRGPALPWRPESGQTPPQPPGSGRAAPDASVKPVTAGDRETLPLSPGGPWREDASGAEDFESQARLLPDAHLRDRFKGMRERLSPLPAAPYRQAPSEHGDVELEGGQLLHDAIPDLIELLKRGSPKLRARAADELGRRGGEASSAVPALSKALSDGHYRVRASAALALGNIGGKVDELRQLLTPLLQDKNPDVRTSAETALSRLD